MKIYYPGTQFITEKIAKFGEPGSDIFANPILQKNNGKAFEEYFFCVCNWLNIFGYHAHFNHSKRAPVTYEVIDGEPFDCEIFCNSAIHCIDVKENFSNADNWCFSRTKTETLLREVINLSNCNYEQYTEAYFLVYFGKDGKYQNKIIRFDVDIIRNALLSGEKVISAEKGKLWTIYKFMAKPVWTSTYQTYSKKTQNEFDLLLKKIHEARFRV